MNARRQSFRPSLPALAAGLALPLALLLFRPVLAEERIIDPEVEKILRERLTVLEEAVKLRSEAHRTGSATLSSMLVANQAVLEAELELASKAADRVRIRKDLLKNAEMLEKAVEELVKSAEAPRMDLLSARANRLRAKADLLLERKAAAR